MKLIIASFSLLLIHFASFGQLTADFTFDDSICVGDCITITNSSTGNITSYSWTFTGATPPTATTENPGTICFNTPGDFNIELTVSDGIGSITSTLPIHVGIYPDSVDAYYDTIIEMGGTAYIFAEGAPNTGTYNWTSQGAYYCVGAGFCFEIFPSPLFTSDYVVHYAIEPGCEVTDTVTVFVKYIDVIDVPNSFSPDDNGINDKVYVKGPGITQMEFKIFDRYGTKMFETTKQEEGWDGFLHGKKLNPATFTWTLDYTLIDGTTNVKSGTITLIK